eukprot:1140588-Pelagomonas_calceolata.AAC.1
MHLTFVEAASSHSSSTSSPSSIIPDYSISLSLGQKLELLGWKDVAMLSGREQELLVGLAEVLMSCSTDETIAKYLINWLPKQKRKVCVSQVQLRALWKISLTSKLARASLSCVLLRTDIKDAYNSNGVYVSACFCKL